MRTFVTCFVAKNFKFFGNYGVSARTREKGMVEAMRTICGQRGVGQFFEILYGRPLWTAYSSIEF